MLPMVCSSWEITLILFWRGFLSVSYRMLLDAMEWSWLRALITARGWLSVTFELLKANIPRLTDVVGTSSVIQWQQMWVPHYEMFVVHKVEYGQYMIHWCLPFPLQSLKNSSRLVISELFCDQPNLFLLLIVNF